MAVTTTISVRDDMIILFDHHKLYVNVVSVIGKSNNNNSDGGDPKKIVCWVERLWA